MKKTVRIMAGTLAVLLVPVTSLRAERTTPEEALRVARNHVRLVLANGHWATSQTPEVGALQEIKRGDRVLGYFCPVKPVGYVVLSLHRELEPVKAFSSVRDLDPELEVGMTALLKDRMAGILDAIAAKLGRAIEPDDPLENLLELNYRAAFDILAAAAFDPAPYVPRQGPRGAGMNYREAEVLLTSLWNQCPPYNQQCPQMSCTWPSQQNFNTNAPVGCVATAGAQIIRYWRWAPPGLYDWPQMCDVYEYDWNGWFKDENGQPVPWNQINWVAALCSNVGLAVGMEYDCDGSSAMTSDMEGVFEEFGYDDACVIYRDDYNAVEWFNILKEQINVNRPLQYRVSGHSIVCDGWWEEWGGDPPHYYWYHMNYGWSGSSDAWYALDCLHLGDPPNEFAIANVVPNVAIGGPMLPYYSGDGAWRYFDQDTWGTDTTFYAAQMLQILRSGFFVRCIGSSAQAVRFYGAPGRHTRFFLDGDPAGKSRVLIQGGCLKLSGGGGMVVR